jgi:hypothetical protein
MLVLKSSVSSVRIDQLTFSPDGTALAAPGWRDGVMLWTTFANGAKSDALTLPKSCVRIAFAANGTLYAGNDSLYAVPPDRGAPEPLPIVPWHTLWFGASPAAARLIVSGEVRDSTEYRLTAWSVGAHREPVWDIRTNGVGASPPLFPPAGARFAPEPTLFDDTKARWLHPLGGHFFLCEYRRDNLRRWVSHRVTRSLATGAELDVSAPLIDAAEVATLSPDGRQFVCRTRGTIRVYPAVGTWKTVPTIKNESKKHFTGMAFHPSGRYLAATSNDKTVKFYDTTTWELARTFTWDIGRMRSVCFSPDGTLAAAGSDSGKVVVWDVDL